MSPVTATVPPVPTRTQAVLDSFGLALPAQREAYYRNGWWRTRTVVDDFAETCRVHADKAAVITYRHDSNIPHRLSYRDLHTYVQRTAGALIHLGVSAGDVVSVQLPNWWQFVVVALAAHKISAALNPIIPIHRRREVTFITNLVESKVYFGTPRYRGFDYAEMLQQVSRDVATLRHRVMCCGDSSDSEMSFEEDILGHPWEQQYKTELANQAVDADGISDLQFTSGTTGEPKGVGHTFNTQYARARALFETLQLSSGDTVFMPSTLAHSTGYVYGCITPVMLGMTAVYQDVWDPRVAMNIVAAEGVVWSFGSTSFIVDMLRAHREHCTDTSTLKYFVSGGAKIPPAVVSQTRSDLGTRLIAVWGMTENGAVTLTGLDEPESAAAESDGKPCPWMELKIVDPVSRTNVAVGTEGELLTRGASQMVGYIRRPGLTAAAIDDEGWLDTGDIARLDAEGHLRITGRSKDIIIRGGENIPVAELEAILYEHPNVAEIAVVGVPDERLGERACAVVVPVSGAVLTLAEITAHLEHIGVSRTYWPEQLHLVEKMPHTLSGKVQKFRIREQLASLMHQDE